MCTIIFETNKHFQSNQSIGIVVKQVEKGDTSHHEPDTDVVALTSTTHSVNQQMVRHELPAFQYSMREEHLAIA